MSDDPDLPRKLRWLAPFPQLANITDPAWLDALGTTQRVTIPAGTVLVRKGSPCQSFLFLYKGYVRVQQISESGREIVLCRVGPGDISVLALMSLADGTTFPADAITETEVQGLCMGLPQFRKAVTGSEDFCNFVLETMARRLREVFLLAEDLAFQRLDVRLASTLCQLFEESNSTSLNITHEQLAIELGTTREVISRLLKDIEQKNACVKLHRGRIELVSPACLRQCARRGFL